MNRPFCTMLLITLFPVALRADDSDDTLRFYLSKAQLVIGCEVLDEPIGLVTEAGVTNYICQVRILSVLHGACDKEKLRVNVVRFDGTGRIPKQDGKCILFLRNVALDTPEWQTADFWFGIMDYHERNAAALKRVAKGFAKQPVNRDPSRGGDSKQMK